MVGNTVYMVVDASLVAQEYTVGRWLSYKTLNTVLAASIWCLWCVVTMVKGLSEKSNQVVGFISKHSLGIYLLHNFLVANERVRLVPRKSAWSNSISG
ncbi:hypothetical protein O9993_20625 [Vibrio lentus]|nr:hypothetical protein [Vibrio lentus]